MWAGLEWPCLVSGPMCLSTSVSSLLGVVLGLPDGGREGSVQDTLWGISPTPLLCQASWAGAGLEGTQSLKYPPFRTLAKALTTPTLNPQPQAPAPDQPAPLPASCTWQEGKAAFYRFTLKDASKPKQSSV